MPQNNTVVLFLGPPDSPLLKWLKDIEGGAVLQTTERITPEYLADNGITHLISYGYRYILKKDVLELLPDRAINLHISLLPWNRGADPNFWSFIEDSPKGVTIHFLDEGVDTGDIITQKEVHFDDATETLASSYHKLQETIQELFKQYWSAIKNGTCPRIPQTGKGSSHKLRDKERLSHILTRGWETPVETLLEYASDTQMSMQFWEKYDQEIEEIRKQAQQDNRAYR
jgi:methionyl-tRNA formyltransferase